MRSSPRVALFLFFLAAVMCLAIAAQAGDPRSALDESTGSPSLSGSLAVGYDSSYVFRGGRYGDHAPWAGIDLNLDVIQNVTLNFGTWYINPTKNEFVGDELDLYLYLCFPVEVPGTGAWDLSLGGTQFFFVEDDADEAELNLLLTKPIGELCEFTFDYVYDITYRGHYFGYSAEKCIPLCDRLDLSLSVGISHGDRNYNYGVLGGDNVHARAGLTMHLTDTTDLGAYILQNWPFKDLADAGEESGLYGGASLTVSF